MINNQPFTAYKGFDKNLSCRKEQFEIGKIYTKDLTIMDPKLCTIDGWHYCRTLEQVYGFYKKDYNNRFCEIEVLGGYSEDNQKGTTTSFRIIREIDFLTPELLKENFKLETLQNIQCFI